MKSNLCHKYEGMHRILYFEKDCQIPVQYYKSSLALVCAGFYTHDLDSCCLRMLYWMVDVETTWELHSCRVMNSCIVTIREMPVF